MTDKTEPGRVVFAGFTTIVGGKRGELWLLEETARCCDDGEAIRARASAFSSGRTKPTVGAVYETLVSIADGRLSSLGRDRTYVAMLDTPALQAAALASRGVEHRERAAKAEEKARASVPGQQAISDLARIVAAARLNDQDAVILALSTAIRREALDLWKAGRK